MPIVLTPTLATATPVLNEAKHPAATRHTTRGTRTRKVPEPEDGSRRVAVVTGGAGAIGGAIRVGFQAIAEPYRYDVRLPVYRCSRDPGGLL